MGKNIKKKILISGLGGSLFPFLHNILKIKYDLFYVDNDTFLKDLYKNLNLYISPLASSKDYIKFIKKIILKHKIDFFIPLIDEEIISVKSEIEGYNELKIISPDLDFCFLALNKYSLMKTLEKEKISIIKSFKANNFKWQITPPIFVKPIIGRGSRGVKKLKNNESLNAYINLNFLDPKEILIQEYLSGIEYTIGVTVNNLNHILSISIKRIIRKKGITIIAVTEKNQEISDLVKKVVQKLAPKGPINIQLFRTKNNEFKIFEINPRFSTTTIMSYACGIDEISLYIDFFDKKFQGEPIQPKEGKILHRRWENIFYEK